MRKVLRFGALIFLIAMSSKSMAEVKEEKPFDFRLATTAVRPHVITLAEKRPPLHSPRLADIETRQKITFLPAAKWTEGNVEYQFGITPRKFVLKAEW